MLSLVSRNDAFTDSLIDYQSVLQTIYKITFPSSKIL